jgi:hypothetical protein
LAIDAKFPCIVVIADISRLLEEKPRRGCSTSFSIPCEKVA